MLILLLEAILSWLKEARLKESQGQRPMDQFGATPALKRRQAIGRSSLSQQDKPHMMQLVSFKRPSRTQRQWVLSAGKTNVYIYNIYIYAYTYSWLQGIPGMDWANVHSLTGLGVKPAMAPMMKVPDSGFPFQLLQLLRMMYSNLPGMVVVCIMLFFVGSRFS